MLAATLVLFLGEVTAGGDFTGVYGLRFDGTFDPFPTCFSPQTALIFIEELDSVLMWEGDELNVNVVIDEVCVPNATFEARFTYSMTTPDNTYLTGETAELTLSGLNKASGRVATTMDNGEFDGSRVLLVSRDNVTVTGSINIDSLSDFRALSVEIIDPPNFAPIGVSDQASTLINQPVDIPVLLNDIDNNVGDTLTVASLTQPTAGSASTDNTVVTYTPPSGTEAVATFEYVATDGALSSKSTQVTVNVVTLASDLIFVEPNEL